MQQLCYDIRQFYFIFITEVIVGGVVVLGRLILKGVILSYFALLIYINVGHKI